MNATALSQLEERIHELSFAEQLWLIERVAQRIREQLGVQNALEHQLILMAADPDVQQELQRIEEQFTPVAADG